MYPSNMKTLLSVIALLTVSLLAIMFSAGTPAYASCAVWGDAIGERGGTPFYSPQPQRVGDRQLDVDIRILQDLFNYNYNGTTRSISFRLCDTDRNKNMSDTTYQITVTKEDDHRVVLNNSFYSSLGLLQLQIQNYSTTDILPYVEQDQHHDNAFVADSHNTVPLKGPFLWDPGVYDMAVKILGYGTNNTYENNKPVFNYTVDIPDTLWEEIQHGNSTYKIKVLSTQKIESFKYDPVSMRLSWKVKVSQEQVLNHTHQLFSDVEIPRSFYEFSRSTFLNATIGNVPIMSAPMTEPIPKSDILVGLVSPTSLLAGLAKDANLTGATVVFSLAPLMSSSTHLDLGHGVHVVTDWSPDPPIANSSEIVSIKFLTANGAPLKNAVYDIYLSNRHGINFEHYDMKVAKNGTDSDEFLFPQNDIYKLYLHLRGVSNSSAPHSIDDTLDGDAYGFVVVNPAPDHVIPTPMIQNNMTLPYPRNLVTPLRQVQMGIQVQDVSCDWSGYQLILKADDGSPACLSPKTAHILIERGWGHFPLRLQ